MQSLQPQVAVDFEHIHHAFPRRWTWRQVIEKHSGQEKTELSQMRIFQALRR